MIGSLLVSAGVSGSDTGGAGGVSIVSGVTTGGFGFFAATFFGATFFGTVGFAAAFLGAAFFTAAFAAFFAVLDLTLFAFVFDFNFALALTGRLAFLAAPFFAAVFLPFATGRFFDLLFFAMINHLLEIVRTRCESSPEKVRCHLCMMLESVSRIQ
jgi:hypothetical protein